MIVSFNYDRMRSDILGYNTDGINKVIVTQGQHFRDGNRIRLIALIH